MVRITTGNKEGLEVCGSLEVAVDIVVRGRIDSVTSHVMNVKGGTGGIFSSALAFGGRVR